MGTVTNDITTLASYNQHWAILIGDQVDVTKLLLSYNLQIRTLGALRPLPCFHQVNYGAVRYHCACKVLIVACDTYKSINQ